MFVFLVFGCAHAMRCMWKPEDNLQEFSSIQLDSENWTQLLKTGGKWLYPLSHFIVHYTIFI